jgi:5-hydroxyisourate hydrolase
MHSGRPAHDVGIRLLHRVDGGWVDLAEARTDDDGRVAGVARAPLAPGPYRLVFDTGAYFAARGVDCFYPLVELVFSVGPADEHLHVPLLVAPFGYTTYRGS